MWKETTITDGQKDRQTDRAHAHVSHWIFMGSDLRVEHTFLWLIRLDSIDADLWLVGASALPQPCIVGILNILRRSLEMIRLIRLWERSAEFLKYFGCKRNMHILYKCCTVSQHSESQVWTGCGRSWFHWEFVGVALPNFQSCSLPWDKFKSPTTSFVPIHPHQA